MLRLLAQEAGVEERVVVYQTVTGLEEEGYQDLEGARQVVQKKGLTRRRQQPAEK